MSVFAAIALAVACFLLGLIAGLVGAWTAAGWCMEELGKGLFR